MQVLSNDATCHDQQVLNDTVLFLRFKIPGTKDDYDPLREVANGQEFTYQFTTRKKEEVKAEE